MTDYDPAETLSQLRRLYDGTPVPHDEIDADVQTIANLARDGKIIETEEGLTPTSAYEDIEEIPLPDGGTPEPVHGVLVGCGEAKLDERAVAKDIYTSNYFQLKRRYAEQHADVWRIVSAEHGLVNPHRPLDPYDTTLDDLGDEEQRAWLASIAEDLHDLHLERDVDRWTILAGGEYYRALDKILWELHVADFDAPTQGMKIGERMGWLKDQTKEEVRV